MSPAAMTLPASTKLGAEWVKDPIDIEDWRRSARRVWRYFKRRTRHRKAEHSPRDREIGDEIGASRRTVQRGLWFLEKVCEALFRDHSGERGRVIRILLPLAGDGKERKAGGDGEGKKPRAKGAAKPSPTPTTAGPGETAAEEVPDPAGDGRSAGQLWAEAKARVAAELAAEKAAASDPGPTPPLPRRARIKGVDPDDVRYLEFKESIGELTDSERARLADLRAGRSP